MQTAAGVLASTPLVLIDPVRVVDGLAYPPDRPGSGLEWDEAEVRRWLLS